MRYRRRVVEVDAVQWTGRNLDEVIAICPDAYTIDSGWTLAIPLLGSRRIDGMRDYLSANAGDYIVRYKIELGHSLCMPMTSTTFEDNYEAL